MDFFKLDDGTDVYVNEFMVRNTLAGLFMGPVEPELISASAIQIIRDNFGIRTVKLLNTPDVKHNLAFVAIAYVNSSYLHDPEDHGSELLVVLFVDQLNPAVAYATLVEAVKKIDWSKESKGFQY